MSEQTKVRPEIKAEFEYAGNRLYIWVAKTIYKDKRINGGKPFVRFGATLNRTDPDDIVWADSVTAAAGYALLDAVGYDWDLGLTEQANSVILKAAREAIQNDKDRKN